MVEWQTRQTQNLLLVTTCGFKSHYPHFLDTLLRVCLIFYTLKTHSNLADTLLTHLFLLSMLINGYVTLFKVHNTKYLKIRYVFFIYLDVLISHIHKYPIKVRKHVLYCIDLINI